MYLKSLKCDSRQDKPEILSFNCSLVRPYIIIMIIIITIASCVVLTLLCIHGYHGNKLLRLMSPAQGEGKKGSRDGVNSLLLKL